MDKQAQAAPQAFRGRLYSRDNTRLKETQILILRTGVSGLHHRLKTEEDREMIASIPPGTELKLYREPDNEHDEWAIAVYLGEDDKLGYVTRYKNEPIARLMDGGKRFVAFVDDPEERAASRGLTVEEWRERGRNKWRNKTSTPTEDLTLPYSIYMIELS